MKHLLAWLLLCGVAFGQDGGESYFDNHKFGEWTADGWSGVVAGDFNGDGKTDIAARRDNGKIWVMLSSGKGFTPKPWGGWSAGVVWEHVVAGDFNGDGRDDLAGSTGGNWWVSLSTVPAPPDEPDDPDTPDEPGDPDEPTDPDEPDEPPIDPIPGDHIWVDPAALQKCPTEGEEWEIILSDAANVNGEAKLSDQNSHHDTYTLAAAIVAVRTGDPDMRDSAMDGLRRVVGTERGDDWLAVSRNIGSYAIAADLLDVRDGEIHDWLVSFLRDVNLPKNVGSGERTMTPFESGSNASAQEGFAYAAIAAYANDQEALDRAWDAFRTYAGDPTAPDRENINISRGLESNWSHKPSKEAGATAVVPAGETRNGMRLDGAIINDMRRGGNWKAKPGHTSYPWVGMEGFVPCALVLHNAGYPAFEVADKAVLRATEYLWWLHTEVDDYWWDAGASSGRARDVKAIINWAYGKDYPHPVTGSGRTAGYTGWTHQGTR